jgi:hypothetical protein
MMNFSGRITRKLCPYLKMTANRNEAASAAFSIPEAMQQCPYVKDLYQGFAAQNDGTLNGSENGESKTGSKLIKFSNDSEREPKLFKMGEIMPICPCEKLNGYSSREGCHIVECQKAPKSDTSIYDEKCDGVIDQLKKEGRYRKFINIDRHQGAFPNATKREAKKESEVVVWCSNDYLGMGQHPKVLGAMHNAIEKSGAGSGGTRNIGGNTNYIEELEMEVAILHGKERGLVTSSCYVANEAALSTLPGILGKDTIYFSDSENHASLIHGIKNGRCDKKIFRHNDTAHLEQLLMATDIDRPKVIVFESVYSM